MAEDQEVALILGRPFLVTSREMVDMSNGRLTFRVGDEEMKFGVGQSMRENKLQYVKVIHSGLEYAFSRCKM
jgi:hypothetical protein